MDDFQAIAVDLRERNVQSESTNSAETAVGLNNLCRGKSC